MSATSGEEAYKAAKDRVEKIRALSYLLQVLQARSIRAHRAMKSAPTPDAFNAAVRLSKEVDDQIEKYRNELFDLNES